MFTLTIRTKNKITMKKIIITLVISLLLFTIANGQTISNKEARQLLENTWNYLKTSDSISFISLWSLNDSISIHQRRPHKKKEIMGNFTFMKEFLDTALNRNLAIDYIDIDKFKLEDTDTKYWIEAWFQYNKHYYKGFGLYIAYMNNKWIVRDDVSTSTLYRNVKTNK